jgi:hypothetical protein
MIALAKQKDKPFEVILVWKFSRFARNQEESIVYKAMLRKNGVDVVSISEPISDNPFGGLIERIIEWMDEYYLIRLSDEVRRGMAERAARGLPNTSPPLGYDMQNGHYVINEAEAPIIRQIFQMYLSGSHIKEITVYLKNIGIRNRNGNFIDNRGVDYILNNPCYIGYVRWNPNGRSASDRHFHNPEDIVSKADHPPIVSKEAFEKAAELTSLRKKTHQKYTRESTDSETFMLKGIVRCHACGATLVYQRARDGLQCHKYARGVCDISHFISLEKVNRMVIRALNGSIASLSFRINIDPEAACLPIPHTIDYDAKIYEEKQKLSRAKEAYQAGIDTLEEYQTEKTKLLRHIEMLQKEKLSSESPTPRPDIKNLPMTCKATELLQSTSVSEELKNIVLKAILQKVVFKKPETDIELYFYT